jgi:SNF2 family DNA or RNA helicase
MKFIPEDDQIKMFRHLVSKGRRKALFVGMGRGKTAATLMAAKDVISDTAGGALVIAPLNVCLLTWPDEIQQWDTFRKLRVANLRTSEGMLDWHTGSADIYIINWESLPVFIRKVMAHTKRGQQLPANIIIYDELSKAKSHSSKRVNMWRRFTYLFEYHWGLTGTPNPNSYMDLFAQFRLLCGRSSPLGTAITKFRMKFFEAEDYNQYKWKLRPGAKEEIESLIAPYVLSLGPGDFPLDIVDVDVPLPNEAKAFYLELEEKLLARMKDQEVSAANAAVLVQKLLQASSGCVYNEEKEKVVIHTEKLKALQKIRKDHPKEPILAVTLFRHERERIMNAFPGAELFNNKPANLARWNAGEIPMWIIDPRSAGHGLNLQRGGHILVWVSQTYSREMWDQTNARLARKGQKNTTIAYRLLCPGTVDWAVAAVLERKGNQQNALLTALSNVRKLHNKTK